jgi:DNA-binding response OmpR family regulator
LKANLKVLSSQKSESKTPLGVRLPGKSGTDVCKEVKEAFSIPILFFSAHAMEENTYKECHADGFIKKPFDVNRLISEIKSHLI